ncbi:MAG: OmpA family protein [Magnetococcales bacterium]|nr:OmpA family protein [Magnetococcales bacterium]
MKSTRRSTLALLSMGILSLGVASCVPQQQVVQSWQVASPRINEGWTGNNGQLQWHPQTGNQSLSSIGTQCYFCGEGIDSDGDGIFDNRDECPGTPKGVKVYWQAEHFGRVETPIGRPGCPFDGDLDGVPDYQDSCPDTARDVKVDAMGCPLDSDHDRVPDDRDKCPNTPHGAAVDSTGCPLDADSDGVNNDMDKCPNTPIGARVNQMGCWVLENLQFSFGSAKIESTSLPTLNRAVDVLADNPKVKVEVQGHTDNIGGEKANLLLSQQRADAVREFLASRGIAADRLTSKGYGFSQPLAKADDPVSRAINRRVELKPLP